MQAVLVYASRHELKPTSCSEGGSQHEIMLLYWQLCCHKPGDLTWPQNCIGIGKAMYTLDPQLLHSYHTHIVVQQ